MNASDIPTTERVCIDLVAMRAWHWQASRDPERAPAIRRWHRNQVKSLSLRLAKTPHGSLTTEMRGMVELLTDRNSAQAYEAVAKAHAGDWEVLCELTREAILRKLAGHPPFGGLI